MRTQQSTLVKFTIFGSVYKDVNYIAFLHPEGLLLLLFNEKKHLNIFIAGHIKWSTQDSNDLKTIEIVPLFLIALEH